VTTTGSTAVLADSPESLVEATTQVAEGGYDAEEEDDNTGDSSFQDKNNMYARFFGGSVHIRIRPTLLDPLPSALLIIPLKARNPSA